MTLSSATGPGEAAPVGEVAPAHRSLVLSYPGHAGARTSSSRLIELVAHFWLEKQEEFCVYSILLQGTSNTEVRVWGRLELGTPRKGSDREAEGRCRGGGGAQSWARA